MLLCWRSGNSNVGNRRQSSALWLVIRRPQTERWQFCIGTVHCKCRQRVSWTTSRCLKCKQKFTVNWHRVATYTFPTSCFKLSTQLQLNRSKTGKPWLWGDRAVSARVQPSALLWCASHPWSSDVRSPGCLDGPLLNVLSTIFDNATHNARWISPSTPDRWPRWPSAMSYFSFAYRSATKQ